MVPAQSSAHLPVYSSPHSIALLHPPNTNTPPESTFVIHPVVSQLPSAWIVATDLVQRDDGLYRQSDQIPTDSLTCPLEANGWQVLGSGNNVAADELVLGHWQVEWIPPGYY